MYVIPNCDIIFISGDGTHEHHHDGGVWGWNDKDLPEEDKKMATILNKEEWNFQLHVMKTIVRWKIIALI